MKKYLLTLLCTLFAAIGAMAQTTYTDRLVVIVDGDSSAPMQATVTFTDNGNGTCDFTLPNFVLGSGDEALPVGNIDIKGLPLVAGADGISTFTYNDNLAISAGDDANVDWFGPMLGEIPLELSGKVREDKIYVLIDINLESLGQIIRVTFGNENFNEKKYTDNLVVIVDGDATDPMQTTVFFADNGNGTCDFRLPNFILGSGDEALPVGNIDIKGLPLVAGADGISTFTYNDNLAISAGDIPTVAEEEWFGPMLGEIPLVLSGKVRGEKIYVLIDINLEALGQIIRVTFGDDNFPTGPVAGEKSGIYLRGSFNSWGTSDEAEFLTTTTEGVYEIKDLTLTNGSDGFKVADANWGDINFGGNGTLTLGQPYTLVAGGGNIKFPSANEYKCSVITLDLNAKTLTVVGEEGGKVVEYFEYVSVAGTAFIGAEWAPAAAEGRMKETTASTYGDRTFEWSKENVAAGEHQFKFTANGAWDINWGGSTFEFGKEFKPVRGGDNISFKLDAEASISIELAINPADLADAKCTIKKVEADGIETIIAEGSVNLYDLQGRRVNRTQNGVVIGAGRKMIVK